ncbi:MAG: hypothetical protein EKK46_14080 [Rhodocyclaceae bacterium]|nr:MAG: hypothetical protein EKK46_14080 [Rhodocyclaceae bacterium]
MQLIKLIFIVLFLTNGLNAQAGGRIDTYVYFVRPSSEDRAITTSGDIATAHSVGSQVAGQTGGTNAAIGLMVVAATASLLKPDDPDALNKWTVIGINESCQPTVIHVANRNTIRTKDSQDLKIFEYRWAHLYQNDRGEFTLEPLVSKSAPRSHPCWSQYLARLSASKESQRFNAEEFYR